MCGLMTCTWRLLRWHMRDSFCTLLQVDNRTQEEPLVTAEQAVALCDRNFGIGGDGVRGCAAASCAIAHRELSFGTQCCIPPLRGAESEAVRCKRLSHGESLTGKHALAQVIFALPPKNGEDYSMRIFNSDGSEPEMCGNGIRCLARFIAERDGANGSTSHRVHTLAGGSSLLGRATGAPVPAQLGNTTRPKGCIVCTAAMQLQ